MSGELRLQVLDAEGGIEREIPLVSGRFEIGRAGKDLACPEDAHMDDRHALIELDDQGARLRDVGRGSGVWLRVEGVDGRPLAAGDQVWLGLQIVVARHGDAGWELHHHGADGRLCGVHPVPPSGLFLGRSSDLPLDVGDSRLSRRHAQVVVEGDGLRLYDRGAHNGTYVRLTRDESLHAGSEFRIAAHRFRVAAPPAVDARDAPDTPEAPDAAERRAAMEPTVVTDTLTHEPPAGGSDPPRGLAARLRRLAARPQRAVPEEPILVVLDGESGSVSIEALPGMTVLEAVREAGLERGEPVDWECGDGGCGVCVLGIVEGADGLDPPDPSTGEMKTIQITEQVVPDPNRYRLACLARVRGTVRLRKLT
jgi:ferredoxin/pSer/pThr/pTyr-binding forkhead associated (FHA) protein